jgi:hypothetical protein
MEPDDITCSNFFGFGHDTGEATPLRFLNTIFRAAPTLIDGTSNDGPSHGSLSLCADNAAPPSW